MENTNETEFFQCKNGLTESNFNEEFCATESSIKVCNKCPFFQYEDGNMICKKFN